MKVGDVVVYMTPDFEYIPRGSVGHVVWMDSDKSQGCEVVFDSKIDNKKKWYVMVDELKVLGHENR